MVAIDVDPLRGESAGVLLVPHDREEVPTLVDLHLKIEKKRGLKNGPQTVFTLCRLQSGSRSEEKSGYHLEAGVKKNPGTIW